MQTGFPNIPSATQTRAFLKQLENLGVMDIANPFDSIEVFAINRNDRLKLSAAEWYSLANLFLSVSRRRARIHTGVARSIIQEGLESLYRTTNIPGAVKMVDLFANNGYPMVRDEIWVECKNYSDRRYRSFLVEVLVSAYPDILSGESSLRMHFEELAQHGMEEYITVALTLKTSQFDTLREKEKYLKWILSQEEFAGFDLSNIYMILDKDLNVTNRDSWTIAELIQCNKRVDVICRKSADIYALILLDNRKEKQNLPIKIRQLICQGFPSSMNREYARNLVDKIIQQSISGEALAELVFRFLNVQNAAYINELVAGVLPLAGTKKDALTSELIDLAAYYNSVYLNNAIIVVLSSLKHREKVVKAIARALDRPQSKTYFDAIQRALSAQ